MSESGSTKHNVPQQPSIPDEVANAVGRTRGDRRERATLLKQIKDNTVEIINTGLGYYIDKIEDESRFIGLQPIQPRVFRNAQTPLTSQNEADFEIILKYCFGKNAERSTFLFTNGYSIFGRPINQSDFTRKILTKAATVHIYLDERRRNLAEDDNEYIKLNRESSNKVSDAGLFREMASQATDNIIYDNLNTIFDLFSELIYYANSEEEAWATLESLTHPTGESRFSSLQVISTLPNSLLATMSHAGIVFKMLDSNNGFKPTKDLMQLINLTTSGGCPFRDEPNFIRIVELFIATMKKVVDND